MGLSKEYTTAGGLVAVDAYHRIGSIHINIEKDDENATVVEVYWNVEITKDKDARDNDMSQIGGFSIKGLIDLGNTKNHYNLIKQGYELLKTLEEYDGALDV